MSDLSYATRIEGVQASRFVRRFVGVVLAAAVAGLWLVAGAPLDTAHLLMQTGFSAVFSFGAIACLLGGK